MGIFHRLFSKKKPENQQVVGSEELMRLSALDSVIPVTAVHFVSAQSFYPLKKALERALLQYFCLYFIQCRNPRGL